MAEICYQNETKIDEEDLSLSILDMSLKHGIPHMHVCGGRARCSTCRVAIVEHEEHLLPRNEAEADLAARKGLDPNIRLACQTRVRGDVALRRLVMDETDVKLLGMEAGPGKCGREADLAVLFSDLRNFTNFSEANLPYDVIHILNRYFEPAGEAIVANGGYIDKYMGDGIMALFGLGEPDPREACLSAVRAALGLRARLEELNSYVSAHFKTELRCGVGIHYGSAVVGEVGHHDKRQFTAIGDTINLASRIESATKECGVEILVSDEVRRHVEGHVDLGRSFDVSLKGKSGTYRLFEVP
jgi:adenylate cyclase